MGKDAALIAWLDERGLAACADALESNDIGLDILSDLSDQDLAEIGLSLGMRRRLLKAAQELRGGVVSATAAPPTIDEVARASAGTPPEGGERRPLTVMFSDVVGSTALSAQLDAEEWRDLLAIYHKTVADTVARFGGYVAQKMGDGAMVYFGYPEAHENDAERAVRAGLAVLEALSVRNRAAETAKGSQLKVRVGVHAGPVVIDTNGFVFGETPNVAARVQTAASPGELVISAPVHRDVAGLVVAEDRGLQNLKGVAEPMELFRVLRLGGTGRRHLAGGPRTGFVGREAALAALAEAWNHTQLGQGQVVRIVADAGLGKTRVMEEFQARISTTPHSWVEFPCSQLLQNTPFHPLAEWARQRFAGVDGEARAAELEKALADVGLDVNEAVPLIAPMLDLPLPARFVKQVMSPEETRRRQIAMVVQWIVAGSRAQRIVVAVEDIQWADPSSLDFVAALIERTAGERLLLLLTARPDFRPPWRAQANHREIVLAPLDAKTAAALARGVPGKAVLDAATVDLVVARCGGVPLYLEEVAKLLSDGGRADSHEVPPTLQASLLARLDRLGPAKEVAQIGAVLGREFGWPLIRAIAGLADDVLSGALDRLAAADMLQSQGRPPDSVYRFNHALFQDAAYDALLKSRRRELHRAVAQAFAEEFAIVARARPELIAHHLTEAGEIEDATFAWQRAGEGAMARGAFVEAAAHLTRGVALLASLPDASKYVTDRFRMLSMLGQCYWACKGFGAAETRAAFESALALGDQVSDTRTLATTLSGLVAAMTQQAQFDGARTFADRLAALAERSGGAFERGWSTLRRGAINFYLGALSEAENDFGAVVGIGSQGGDTAIGGVTLAGMATIYMPWLTVITGRVEAARAQAEAGLKWSEAVGGPHDRAFALTGAAMAHLHVGDAEGTLKHVQALLDVTERHNLRVLASTAPIFSARAIHLSGQPVEAAARFPGAMAAYEAIGQRILLNWFRAMMADALADTGQLDQALAMVNDAVMMNEVSPLYAPEVLRIRGTVLRRRAAALTGTAAAAAIRESEASLRSAIEEAEKLGAGLFARAAAKDLSR